MKVKKAEYVKDYKIKLLFSDGMTKLVDFKPFLKDAKNLFIPLLNIEYFKSFAVDDTTISWPNEVDFCPDVLYEIGVDISEKKIPTKKAHKIHRRKKTSEKAEVKYRTTYALSKKNSSKAKS